MVERPDKKTVETYVENLLYALGLERNTPGLVDTPARVANMYVDELFKGLYTPPPVFTVFPNDGKYDQMVVLKDIKVLSTCEHHLLPFVGRAHVAYIPERDGMICGISKLVRIVDWFARRPQVQERLTQQVADFLREKLKPVGVIVVIEARHQCMLCRGVLEDRATMVTSAFHGAFEEQAVRGEFFSLVGR